MSWKHRGEAYGKGHAVRRLLGASRFAAGFSSCRAAYHRNFRNAVKGVRDPIELTSAVISRSSPVDKLRLNYKKYQVLKPRHRGDFHE